MVCRHFNEAEVRETLSAILTASRPRQTAGRLPSGWLAACPRTLAKGPIRADQPPGIAFTPEALNGVNRAALADWTSST
jgi:hypothetical protein